MKHPFIFISAILILVSHLGATPYATYNGDDNQTPANPTGQGWTVSGALNQGFTDATNGNTLGWELNDNTTGDANPTMFKDYGSANTPQSGDVWSLTVNCRIFAGNAAATNLLQWSNGTTRSLCFLYEDATGNIDILYWNTNGAATTIQDYTVNDDAFHNWAIVHDGTNTTLTYDGADVASLGKIAANGAARGVHVGGGSSGGTGALYVASVNYDATLAAGSQTTKLGRAFADHMVLQRGEPVKISGTDSINPGSQAISVTFDGQIKNTTTDAQGNWHVTLNAMTANATGQNLVVTGSSVKTITDVLIGEVWLAAGQSNMNWRVNQSSTPPHAATYPLIRMCNWEGVVGTGSGQFYNSTDLANLTPENFYAGSWQVMNASTVQAQSAVAYFFAHNLATHLNVPIGIVDTSIGGTSTESFISPAAHASSPQLTEAFKRPHLCRNLGQWTGVRLFKNVYNNNVANYTHADPAKPHPHPYAPGFLYYTGIEHLKNFTFKGAIWYQGESNAEFTSGKYQINGNRLSDYQTEVMKTLVNDWRSAFDKADFPFYMVQLPRINASNRAMWPFYREAQARVAKNIDGCELATVVEYGANGSDVHPPNKEPVGERLAAIARAKLYGDNITYSGPVYTNHTVSGNKIILHFDHTGGGLTDKDGSTLRNFEIAGLDRSFVAATATIVGNTVEVTAAAVSAPVAVRHAWEMNPDVDLYNGDGFSSSSFRTDKWIAAPGRKLRIACIGDSITFGYGIAADLKYPAQLEKILGTTNFEVQNFGHSGAGIYRVSNRYADRDAYTNALAWQPDVVICNLGINDITGWNVTQHAAFETEFFKLVDTFTQSGNVPLFLQWSKLAPLYPGQAFYGSPNLVVLNDWIRQAAASTNALIFDMEAPLSGHPEWFPDHIHPNATGAREIAETTFCTLSELGDFDAQPFISELLAINTNGIQDENGNFSGWLEISNQGTAGVCLNQYYLTNSLGNPTQWQVPASTVIEPGKNLTIFASGKDRAVNAAELHTSFTLPANGGSLSLLAADSITVLDTLAFPAQHANISYGRTSGASIAVAHGSDLTYLVPSIGSLGTGWTATAFDDSAWTAGTSGLGFEAGVTAFDGSKIWDDGPLVTTPGFQNGWSELSGSGTTEALNGTILEYDHSGSAIGTMLDGSASTLDGTGWSSIRSGDWTVEVNIKINDSPNGFMLWFGTGTSSIWINVQNDRTTDFGENTFTALHANNDGAFHTFKVSHDSAAKKYHVWRDNVLLTPAGGVVYDSVGSGESRLLFGDFTNGSFGNNFDVEIASISYAAKLYNNLIQTDVQTAMQNVNPGIYLRMPFTLSNDPATFSALYLDIQYDDGFVVYLNGTEVARRNAPASRLWNSASTSDRPDNEGLTVETIDLTDHLDLLNQGANVLAIHAMNSSVIAERFLIHPVLSPYSSIQTLFFQTPTPGNGNGGNESGSLPYATWKAVHGVSSDQSDDDNDGIPALMEFITGSSPTTPTTNTQLKPAISSDGVDEYLTVSFRVANNLSGLSYWVEYSDDLVTAPIWETDTTATLLNAVDNGNGSSTLTYRLTSNLATAPSLFSRVVYHYSE